MTEQAPSTHTAPAEGEDAGEGSGELHIDARRIGERLGRYQLVLPLAQGGMGLVFAGRLVGPHGVERLVAIKTLRPITSASDRAALLREARLTARLHHRNVVATLDLGEVDDVPYVVMELVDGVSLSALLGELKKRGRRLAPELAAWVVMQAALGLHAAHELSDADGKPLGLVHRDVSPQNILLSVQGEVKIADFGIAKYTGREESTATGMIKGKFGYMSPEQAQSADVDRTSDVFALGIVFWEALTGEKLFSAETPARTLLRVLEHVPRSPAAVRPEVGDELSAIVLSCLAKDPSDRYATASSMADAIRAALRARGTPVDEGDLAALVQELFGEERARTMEKIRSADAMGGDGETETAEMPPVGGDASALVAVSMSTDPHGVPKRRALRARVAAVGVAAIAGVAAAVWATSGEGTNGAGTNGAGTRPSASTGSRAAPAPASASATPVDARPVAATPSALASSPASAGSLPVASSAPARAVAPRRTRSAPAASAGPTAVPVSSPAASTAPPAPPPPAPPTTGQPFQSL